ncbi:hypothetical protein PP613_03885 [Mycobacteroides abscessus]|nr:hypothetical protein [Mycobacteroides abscessus]MDM2408490.1 hypothetical protein [Mycobacteroides abscessus]
MTARKAANSAAKPANTPVKRAPCKQTASKTPGQKLVADLSEPGDPYSIQILIEQAGHAADYLDRMNALLNGDRDSWLQVKIGTETTEVVVNNVLIQQRAQSEQLRKLIAAVQARRGKAPSKPNGASPLEKY